MSVCVCAREINFRPMHMCPPHLHGLQRLDRQVRLHGGRRRLRAGGCRGRGQEDGGRRGGGREGPQAALELEGAVPEGDERGGLLVVVVEGVGGA